MTSRNTAHHSSRADADSTRPSLSAARGGEGGNLSILASLESRERPLFAPARSRLRWLGWTLGALTIAIAAFALRSPIGAWLTEWGVAAPTPSSLLVTNSPVVPTAAATTVAAAAPVPETLRDSPATVGPAHIETIEPVLAQVVAASAPAHRAHAHRTAAAPMAKSAHQRNGAGTDTNANAGKDPDADLLAALMAHMSQQSGAATSPATRNSAKFTGDSTIAKLVKRCDGMSGEEARECQRRICEGYWGKAQACPARAGGRNE